MLHVGNVAVLVDVNVESVRLIILGDHHSGLDDPVFLRKVPLAEALRSVSACFFRGIEG